MNIEVSERLKALPPYLFRELDRLRDEVKASGVDIIDFGVGDPDLPTPRHIVEAIKKAVENPSTHRYPSYSGMNDFRDAVARWYERRFGVKLDPPTEVITLIGSKEGIAHIPLAFLNPGDVSLVPSPAYPVYHTGTILASGISYFMPLEEKNGFLPNLNAIPEDVAQKAKLMFLNYPNNPTSAVADREFFEKVVAFAKKYDVIVCHDAAYSELAFDGYKPMSFMEVDGAKEIGIEFHSLSKTYNMTGWRLGFAVGNAEVVRALGQVKSNVDSGAFNAVQIAGIAALEGNQDCVVEMCRIYQERRDILVAGLREVGLNPQIPKATFYVWCPVPDGMSSTEFSMRLLKEAGIVVTPGNGFGDPGEGYVRFALTVSKERTEEAIERMKKLIS